MENEILLTGGSGYIGSALTKHLREKGHEVLAPSSDELNTRHPLRIEQFCYGKKFSAMILAHGSYGFLGPIKDLSMALWQHALETNLFGSVLLIQKARVSGPIIVFGGAGGGTIPLPERSAYAASKAALTAIVVTGAAEGLNIYGVAPGPQPSTMQEKLFGNGVVSEKVKAEMKVSLMHSPGLPPILAIVDEILAGGGEPGHFYSARAT